MQLTYKMEIVLEGGVIVRMIFLNKIKAENARRRLAKASGAGNLYKIDLKMIAIKSEASTYNIDPSRVYSVSVSDVAAWRRYSNEEMSL